MAGLRGLRVHLKSVKTTGQLANAMKTVSTAKYSRINGIREKYLLYANSCKDMLSLCNTEKVKNSCDDDGKENVKETTLYVLLTGNRGLCGGYNSELLKTFETELEKYDENSKGYEIVSCGKTGNAYLKEKEIPTNKNFVFPDVPEYENALELSDFLLEKYNGGEVSKIVFVYRKFINMLRQEIVFETILPAEQSDSEDKINVDEDIICVPSKQELAEKLFCECIHSAIYGLLLECALGVQAATMMTMRTASDNANELSDVLEVQINRRRQNDVTSSVLETSSSMYAEHNEKSTETTVK